MEKWKLFKNTWISIKPVLPCVWERREGGHVVRARVIEQTTGKEREIWKVLQDEPDRFAALKWLEGEKERLRVGHASPMSQVERFSEFAKSLFEHKVKVGEIKSAKGRQKFGDILVHLISGTKGTKAGKHVPGFGDFFVDKIETEHSQEWKGELADLINAGDYAPTTINGWFSTMRVVAKAAKRKYKLEYLWTEGLEDFDTSDWDTYTEEEPNALFPHEVGPYLARFLEMHPQHYAMTYIGLITGLRPSSLRPLRRRGPEADVQWDTGRIYVRRSHTLGDEVMKTTKQKRRYGINLPEEAMTILRWHVETQLRTPEQQDSDLLFPAITGGFRSPCVLNKPLAEVAEEVRLGKKFSQKGLRRTAADLHRDAATDDIITKSITGWLTPAMHELYSTVRGGEQRQALAKVIRLFAAPSGEHAAGSGEHSGEHAAGSGEQIKKAS